MAKQGTIHVGVIRTDPRDLTKDQGHDYGAGRRTQAMADKRTKRRKTRAAQNRDALKGW